MANDIDELLKELNLLWNNFNNCRSHFPFVPNDAKGAKMVRTAPYYIAQGFDISFVFSEGISEEGINKINQIGHWINQNFVIRLCALFESFKILSNDISINFNLNGAEHVNIVRRLRNCFAHSSGRYNPNDNDHKKTMNLIRDFLGLSVDDIVDWPLSINTVLRPLFEGCVNYAKQKMDTGYDFREL